jgi:HSP90 family molecular chaperone
VLFDQALLAEGGELEDPASFVRRVNAAAGGRACRRRSKIVLG